MMKADKISPVFDLVFTDEKSHERREAIVLYRPPPVAARVRGRMKVLQERLHHVRRLAEAQTGARDHILADYNKMSAAHFQGERPGSSSPIGTGALPISRMEVTPAILAELSENPAVLAILPNQAVHLISPQRVSFRELSEKEQKDGLTWGLSLLEIPKLWETTKGEEIRVAVIDTGVHQNHSVLARRVSEFVVIDPSGTRINASPSFDAGQHGTHVCGTIAGGETDKGVAVGVAPMGNLFVAAVLLGNATIVGLLEAISWAVEQGADIINLSLGLHHYEPLFEKVFATLLEEYSVLPVVSIGNAHHGNTTSPGNIASVLSVGALENRGDTGIDVAFFSSGASFVFPNVERDALVTKPDIVAPGAQIFSCIPPELCDDGKHYYCYMDGTSMAAPHVAGVAALLMAASPTVEARTVFDVLRETASHPQGHDHRPDNRWGYGVISPGEALKAPKS